MKAKFSPRNMPHNMPRRHGDHREEPERENSEPNDDSHWEEENGLDQMREGDLRAMLAAAGHIDTPTGSSKIELVGMLRQILARGGVMLYDGAGGPELRPQSTYSRLPAFTGNDSYDVPEVRRLPTLPSWHGAFFASILAFLVLFVLLFFNSRGQRCCRRLARTLRSQRAGTSQSSWPARL